MLVSLPWLVPMHAQPWTSFHTEAAMAVAGFAVLAWAIAAGPARFQVPFESQLIALLGLVPLVQWATGLIVFAGDAWLAAIYLFSLAAAVAAGARAQLLQPWALPNALFVGFGIAALVSFVLMLLQWMRWEGLGTLLMTMPKGSRLAANLGQPNQLATLLVWGLIGLWWAYLRYRAHAAVVSGLAALLLLGVAMTQSRTGALEVVLLGVAAMLFRRQLRSGDCIAALVALGVWFFVAFLAWAPLNELLRPGQVQALQERLAPGTRLLHWKLLLDAVAMQPWFGWGWNQIVHAQWELAPLHPISHEVVQYGHNLILDLMLWNGVPIGIAVSLALAAWCVWQFRLAQVAERVLLLLAVAVFAVHAMFELPHGYLLFLLPVGLMVGTLHVPMRRLHDRHLDRGWVAVPAAALGIAALSIVRDYGRIEDAWTAYRFRVAQIGTPAAPALPETVLLSNMRALLLSMQTDPQASMSVDDLVLLREVAQRYPSAGALFRYAWALALTGDTTAATRELTLLCRIHSPTQCAAAKEAWLTKANQGHAQAASIWPVAP